MKTLQFAALYFIFLLGSMPIAASAQPYVISTDGSEVTDQKTGLIWRRCAEGMVFSGGTCTGSASVFTHPAALQHAVAQAGNTGIAWRLPNIKELSSIADKSLFNPSIDPAAFPGTPASRFWSASPYVGLSSDAWVVFFYNGVVGIGGLRYDSSYVRLVRVTCSGSCVSSIAPPTAAPNVTISANPELIRSGKTSTVIVNIDSTYKVRCTITGANSVDDIINHLSAPSVVSYSITTKTLTSTQVVSIECVYTDYPSLTINDEVRVKVIPIVQEI